MFIRVIPEELIAHAREMDQLGQDYRRSSDTLIREFQDMQDGWMGVDEQIFQSRIPLLQKDYLQMAAHFENAANCLRVQSTNYRNRQEDNIVAARNLYS